MPGKRLVASQKNWWKGKKDVVASMDSKLAGGRNADLAREYRKAQWRKKMSNTTIYAIIIIVAAGVFAAFNWKTIKKTLSIQKIFYAMPAKSLARDYSSGAITADQYARYLCDLLVNYRQLPEKYKGGTPRFKRDDVFAQLARVWPKLSRPTQHEIQQYLPTFTPQMSSE